MRPCRSRCSRSGPVGDRRQPVSAPREQLQHSGHASLSEPLIAISGDPRSRGHRTRASPHHLFAARTPPALERRYAGCRSPVVRRVPGAVRLSSTSRAGRLTGALAPPSNTRMHLPSGCDEARAGPPDNPASGSLPRADVVSRRPHAARQILVGPGLLDTSHLEAETMRSSTASALGWGA